MLKMEQSGSLWIAINAKNSYIRNQNWYSNEIMLKSYKRSDIYILQRSQYFFIQTLLACKKRHFFLLLRTI